jgi:uncharacterized protein involved in outer membrane biogenesis
MEPRTAPPQEHGTAPRRRHQALALLALLLLLLWLLFDWNWFKGPIERRVEAATGREFRIEGDLDVDWAWMRPTVIADGVVLGNADWADTPEMFRASHAAIEWSLWPMLRGDWHLTAVRLESPVLNLQRDAEGRANWDFDDPTPTDDTPADLPRIDQLHVEDGRFTLREAELRTDLAVAVRSVDEPDAQGAAAPLVLSGDGRYRGNAFTLQGRIDSPLALAEDGKRFRVDLEARAGKTRARAFGGLDRPLQLQDFDLGFEIAGADMAQLYPLLGLAIPRTSAYSLEGKLTRTGAVWGYRDVSGVVGDSDLAGQISVDTGRERTLLTADLVSKNLDFDDLAGFIGGTPRQGEGNRPTPPTTTGRLFPAKTYDLSKLRSMDADVRLRANRLNAPGLPLEAMDAHLVLVGGDLRLDPLDFAAAGGDIAARVHLDARSDPIAADIDLRGRRLELPKLFPKAAPESTGRVGGRIRIGGHGNSIAALMATADGDIGVAMGPGRISNLTLELAGLDIAEALKFLIGKDKVVPVRCGFADFKVKDGVMQTRAFAFDTTDTLLLAEGEIHLGTERLDLLLKPRPKDASPFSLRSPLRVRGTLLDPSIRPQGGPLFLRGAAAAALYAVAPPAALLALIETGPGENADCGRGADAPAEKPAP